MKVVERVFEKFRRTVTWRSSGVYRGSCDVDRSIECVSETKRFTVSLLSKETGEKDFHGPCRYGTTLIVSRFFTRIYRVQTANVEVLW